MKFGTFFILLFIWSMLDYTNGDTFDTEENVNQSDSLMANNYFPIPQTNALYKFYSTPKTLRDADITCEDEGADLYYPNTEEESNIVSSFMQDYKGALGYGWFLGIKRIGYTFETLTGIPISHVYTKWSTDEPNCVVFVATLRRVKIDHCWSQYPFICKSRPRLNEQNENCDVPASNGDLIEQSDILKQGGALKDYFPIPHIKALYKIYRTPKTFEGAKTTCENEGASLYYPETEEESNAVLSFMKTCKDSNAYGWYLGIVRSGTNFEPINVTSLTQAYTKWNIGEPNNAGLTEDCVLFISALTSMSDVPCSHEYEFICKWKPNDVSVAIGATVNLTQSDGLKESSYAYGGLITETTETTKNLTQSSDLEESSYIYRVSSERTTNLKPTNDLGEYSYDFIPQTKSLYKLHHTIKTFHEAMITCDEEGAVLFYPESKDESNAVLTFIKNKYRETLPKKLYFGSVKPANVLEKLSSLSMSKLNNNWVLRESKSNNTTAKCVEFVTSQNLVNDVTYNNQNAFICKRRQNYGYSEEIGKCYKFHLTPKNWADAQETCRAERSHLAVINSHEEASYLVRLTRSTLRNIPGNFTRGVVLLGFHNNNVQDWQTIEGKSLYYSGYACWGNSQPDGGERDRCGSMFYNGHLNDIACDQKAFFICEHDNTALNYVHEPRSFYNVIQSLRCYDTI